MISHKSYVSADLVNPKRVVQGLQWLAENNALYKDVVLNKDWINDFYATNKEFFDIYMPDNPDVCAKVILEKVLDAVCSSEGEEIHLNQETFVQPENVEVINDQQGTFNIAPGQGETPLSMLTDKNAEGMAFPTLFPHGKGMFTDSRQYEDKLSHKDYANVRLLSSDRRFAKRSDYIFSLKSHVEREQLVSQASIHLKKGQRLSNGQKINAGAARNLCKDRMSFYKGTGAYKFMKNVRGSPAYWDAFKYDALAMVKQVGIFTWFLTISFNDIYYSIPGILAANGTPMSSEEIEEFSFLKRNEILNSDPVIAAMVFNRYAHKIINYLLVKEKMLGDIEAYFGRVEFQHRGSPHLHICLKIKDAPILDVNTDEEVCKFIDQYVTCGYPTLEQDEDLHNLVKLQVHKHVKRSCEKYNTECRFNFPHPEAAETHIFRPDDAKPVIRYKRNSEETMISQYNTRLLQCVRSNMNLQFVTSSWDLINYVVGYTCKKEQHISEHLKDVIKDTDTNMPAKENLKKLGNAFINANEESIQEGIYKTIPDFQLTFCHPEVIFVPASMPTERVGILKRPQDLNLLEDGSEDIFQKSLIDRYKERPDDKRDMCLADFCAWYKPLYGRPSAKAEIISLKNDTGRMVKRLSKVIVRSHTPSRKTDPEKYYYNKLCLYFPWVTEDDIMGENLSYAESFTVHYSQLHDAMARFEAFSAEQLDDIFEEAVLRQNLADNELLEEDHPDNTFIINRPHPGMRGDIGDDLDLPPNVEITYENPTMPDVEYEAMIRSLNEQQRNVFNLIQEHCNGIKNGLNMNQLIHFISGAGGVGKSHLIKCIRNLIQRTFGSSLNHVIVAAPTGAAAVVIDAVTLHWIFKLPIKKGARRENVKLASRQLQRLRETFEHVKYVIIDEISMLGVTNLNYISDRLNVIKSDLNTIFGNVNVIFCGDLYQLPPIGEKPCYSRPNGIGALAPNLWEEHVTFSELTEVMRSKDDAPFASLCHRIRTASHTPEDTALLQSRTVKSEPSLSEYMESIYLVATNKQLSLHNEKCIAELRKTQTIITITAQDRFANPKLQAEGYLVHNYVSPNINDTGGFPTQLEIGVGAKVMIKSNIDTSDKLVNGSIGVVAEITNDPNNPNFPKVYLRFEDPTIGRKSRLLSNSQNVLIKPTEARFGGTGKTRPNIVRCQLPLTLSWAQTIHKSQGSTYTKAFIDLTGIRTPGQAYVAISRLTSLEGLHFIKFNLGSLTASKPVAQEYDRLRTKTNVQLYKVNNVPLSGEQPSNVNTKHVNTDSNEFKLYDDDHPVPSARVPTENKTNAPPRMPRGNTVPRENVTTSPLKQQGTDPGRAFDDLATESKRFLGYARVIDFGGTQDARETAQRLNLYNFQVNENIESKQHGPSCGYNSALACAALADSEDDLSWFRSDISNCYIEHPERRALLELANRSLRIPNVSPRYIWEENVRKLFQVFSETIYNKMYTDDESSRYLYTPNHSHVFRNDLIHEITTRFIEGDQAFLQLHNASPSHFPLSVYLLNTARSRDSTGSHWYIVAVEMFMFESEIHNDTNGSFNNDIGSRSNVHPQANVPPSSPSNHDQIPVPPQPSPDQNIKQPSDSMNDGANLPSMDTNEPTSTLLKLCNRYEAHARIIDFLGVPESDNILRFLQNLNFNVKRSVHNDAQVGTSCGYNSAAVIAKLAHFNNSKLEWKSVPVIDCCNKDKLNHVRLANHLLDSLNNNAARLLNDDEVFQLVPSYIEHNIFAFDPLNAIINLDTFDYKNVLNTFMLEDTLSMMVTDLNNNDRPSMPLRVYLVCTDDIQLPHFMVLAIEIIRKPDLARPPSPPSTSSKRHCISTSARGKARVFDLLSYKKSYAMSTKLEQLGFEVNNIFTRTQVGPSCGYIAAMITAQLAIHEDKWYEFMDMQHDLPVIHPEGIRACNIHLNIQSVEAVFLTGKQCEALVGFFYEHFSDGIKLTNFQCLRFLHNYPSDVFADKVRELKQQFEDHDLRTYDRYHITNGTFPLYISLVNTHDAGQPGEHWYLVAFEMSLESSDE